MTNRFHRTVTSNRRHRPVGRGQHLLEVKVRAATARRQRRQKIGRLFWSSALVIAFAVAAWVGISTGLDKFFFSNPGYTLNRVTFELDGVMSREEALAATGLREGENIFLADLTGAENALRAIPLVADVVIERHLPDEIAITLTSRIPVAWVAPAEKDADPFAPENALLADASGFLMKASMIRPEFYSLPVISGVLSGNAQDGGSLHQEDLRQALDLLREVKSRPECLLGIRSMDISKGYCIEVISDQNARITFSSEDYAEQLARLRQLLEHCRERRRELESVNLMARRNTPVTFVPIAAALPKTAQNLTEKGR